MDDLNEIETARLKEQLARMGTQFRLFATLVQIMRHHQQEFDLSQSPETWAKLHRVSARVDALLKETLFVGASGLSDPDAALIDQALAVARGVTHASHAGRMARLSPSAFCFGCGKECGVRLESDRDDTGRWYNVLSLCCGEVVCIDEALTTDMAPAEAFDLLRSEEVSL